MAWHGMEWQGQRAVLSLSGPLPAFKLHCLWEKTSAPPGYREGQRWFCWEAAQREKTKIPGHTSFLSNRGMTRSQEQETRWGKRGRHISRSPGSPSRRYLPRSFTLAVLLSGVEMGLSSEMTQLQEVRAQECQVQEATPLGACGLWSPARPEATCRGRSAGLASCLLAEHAPRCTWFCMCELSEQLIQWQF